MKRYSCNKDINKIIKSLCKKGWCYTPGKKHRGIVSPEGIKLTIPGTPSDIRALYNFKQDVRRVISGETNYDA